MFRFELRRTVTVSRIAVWLLLTSFPIFIVGVMKYNEAGFLDEGFRWAQARKRRPFDLARRDEGQMIKLELRRGGLRRRRLA